LISIGKFETNLQICGESQMPYQKMTFLIHSHFDLKMSHFDSKNCLPDEVKIHCHRTVQNQAHMLTSNQRKRQTKRKRMSTTVVLAKEMITKMIIGVASIHLQYLVQATQAEASLRHPTR
jgi:hypothetical protein